MLFSGNKFNGIYESSLFNRWPWFRRGSTAIGRVKKEGYDVLVVYYHGDHFFVPFLKEKGVAYRYVGGANRVDEKFIKVFKTIKSFGPDAVISYMGGANMLACLIRLAGRRFHLIVSERSLTQRLDLKTRLKFFLYRFSDYVVPNSHA